jgi:hypothetical protein
MPARAMLVSVKMAHPLRMAATPAAMACGWKRIIVLPLKIGTGVNYPAHHLPLIRWVAVVAGFAVDDLKTQSFDLMGFHEYDSFIYFLSAAHRAHVFDEVPGGLRAAAEMQVDITAQRLAHHKTLGRFSMPARSVIR